jgi:hypothetical protein
MKITERFDRWVNAGDFTLDTLARFRIILAIFLLSRVPDFEWVSQYPSAWYTPPPGPFELLNAFPPSWFMRGVELAATLSLAAMLIGWKTKAASFVASAMLVTGYGFTYSLGKIDHNILMLLAPAVLAFSGWGRRLSLDSRGDRSNERLAVQWPVRFLALLLGAAFATAALPKVQGGWLDPTTHAVQATLFDQYFGEGRTRYLADTFLGIESRLFWESLDYLTIALEVGLLFAILSWKSLRVACAVACTFHLSVYLMMNIAFTANVMVYAAFVQWDRIFRSIRSVNPPAWVPLAAISVLAFGVMQVPGTIVNQSVLGVGALIGIGYLAVQARSMLVRTARHQSVGGPVIDVRESESVAVDK